METRVKWFVCEFARNKPKVCIEICAANCKVKGKFGHCKIYEENAEWDEETHEESISRTGN